MKRSYLFVLLAAALAVGGYALWPRQTHDKVRTTATPAKGTPMVAVKVPEITGLAKMGESAFNVKCAVCHGKNAAGQQGVAPPLIHRYYRPAHHGDEAFQRAAALGVTSHHWNFGNMPPLKGLTRGDMKNIIAYVRALQHENGIF